MTLLDNCFEAKTGESTNGPFKLIQRQEANRFTRVPDPTGFYPAEVLRAECRNGDEEGLSAGTSRVEGQGHRVIAANPEYWSRIAMWLPSELPKVPGENGFLTLFSTFGLEGGELPNLSSPFRFDIKNNLLGISIYTGGDRAWQSPLGAKENYYGQWLVFTFHSLYSKTGWVEAWIKVGNTPEKQITFWKPGECQNNEGHGPEGTKWELNTKAGIETDAHCKFDLYRRNPMSGWGSNFLYATKLRVGTTKADVIDPVKFTYEEEEEEPPPRTPVRTIKGTPRGWRNSGKLIIPTVQE